MKDEVFVKPKKQSFEDIDYYLDNFFLGLKLYTIGDAIGLRYMLGAIHDLAFCKDEFESFAKKAIAKYRVNIKEELCHDMK